MSKVMDYEIKQRRPIGERINFRLALIVAVVSLLVGWPVYGFVRGQMNHGIEKHGNEFDVDLKALGCFKFSDGSKEPPGTLNDIPVRFRNLDGQKVALEGFVYAPQNSGGNVNTFEFVYNINKCCLNGPPAVHERVFATYPGRGFDPPGPNDEIRIVGRLHVKVLQDEVGVIRKLYTMDVERLERL